jgi:RNA-directed DNA polymerase
VLDDPRLQAAGASILKALDAPAFLVCREGDRPDRGAGDAVRALSVDRQDGRYGEGVAADMKGVCDPMDHDGRLAMRRWRLAERAFLGLIRQWRKAGRLETAGRVIPPETGVPQGGGVSPGPANVVGYEALDRWGAQVVKPHGRGAAWRSRDADDWVCAFRFRSEAEGFDQGLPKRRGKFTREVAPEKTRIRRCSRFPPGMTRRCTVLGVEWFGTDDR